MSERSSTALERLRETVAIRVQATSLRAVARQVGMSPTGLEKFLSGGTPYSRSRAKLQEWWEREGARPRSDITGDGIAVAIGALVRDLRPEHRPDAMRGLILTLREMYGVQGAPLPPWLGDLCARWLPDLDPPADFDCDERDEAVSE
jgi:hypothetical protein